MKIIMMELALLQKGYRYEDVRKMTIDDVATRYTIISAMSREGQ